MIHFREVNEPHGTDPGFTRWQVEVYSPEGGMFPVGIAFVVEVRGVAQINLVFVVDEWRRRGFGKELLSAVIDRWPNPRWTSAMDERGEALLRSVGLTLDDES